MPKAIRDLAITYDYRPSAGSQASQELSNCPNEEILEVAYNHGALQFLFVSSDHMSGLRRALTPSLGVLSCTPWTCARGVLESCSNGVWLLDTEIDSKERITRSLNLRLQDQYIQKKLAHKDRAQSVESTQGNSNLIRKIEARIKYLRKKAYKLSIAEKKNKRGEFLGFGSGLPSISARIASTLNADYDYAMLSSAAHGNEFATLSLSVKVIEQTKNRLIATPCLDPKNAVYLIFLVIEWFARASWTYFSLFGWDLERLQSILEKEYNRADINEESRFWRGYAGL